MASISFDEKCSVVLSDHAKHLSIACNELFEQQTFSDVTLAAEDYRFDGHRLVLVAFSPYFQQMLTNVPANQHTIVFLKDVLKQTLYDLMKYIYCGEVNVNREHLDEFLNTAKSLQIKGLIDDQNVHFSECQSTNLSFPATEMSPKPTIRGFQYQSTSASFRAETPTNTNTTSFSIYPAPNFYDHRRDRINDGNLPETKVDTHVSDENYYDEDQFDDVKNDLVSEQGNNGRAKSFKRTAAHTGAPKRKRVKRNDGLLDYNIVADIRSMSNGRQRLIYDDYKFYAQHTATKTRWLCCSHATRKCNAIISTTAIDGKTMMKIVRAEHTHQAKE